MILNFFKLIFILIFLLLILLFYFIKRNNRKKYLVSKKNIFNQEKKKNNTLHLLDKDVSQKGIIKANKNNKKNTIKNPKPIGWVQSQSYDKDIQEVETKKPIIKKENNIEQDKKQKILIVDDSITVLKYITKILEKEYIIVTKMNGQEALNYLLKDEINPDLIISDIEMPEMNGIDLVKKIRKQDRYNRVPILVISAYAEKHLELMEKELIQGFMLKPFNNDDFINQIQYLIG
jgi:CheY-like chemotaxis protein